MCNRNGAALGTKLVFLSAYLNPRLFLPQFQTLPASIPDTCLNPRHFLPLFLPDCSCMPQSQTVLPASIPDGSCLNPRLFLPQSQTLPASIPDCSCLNSRHFLPQSQTPASIPDTSCPNPRHFLPQSQTVPASIPDTSCLNPRRFLPQSQTFPASIPDGSCLNPKRCELQYTISRGGGGGGGTQRQNSYLDLLIRYLNYRLIQQKAQLTLEISTGHTAVVTLFRGIVHNLYYVHAIT